MARAQLPFLKLDDPKIRTLHFAWFAFFLTFVLWFNHAPLMVYIREDLALDDQQVKALLTLNVAFTIPARILVGILVDRFGPRNVFTGLLVISSFLCFGFALATNFEWLALTRGALGFVGAGFVIGIRLVSEWFPAKQVGLAQGIYGGWGNFGSAAAAMALPAIAMMVGGENGWRLAIAATGGLSLVYAFFFHRSVRNTPKGSTYFKPKKTGGLEVTSRSDFAFYIAMNVPMYAALGVLAWKLSPSNLGLLSDAATHLVIVGLVILFGFQVSQITKVNREMLKCGVPELYRYKFKQVAVLDVAYFITFGAELAMVSILPLFFLETFEEFDPIQAGLLASAFAFTNLVARPVGGWLSDRTHRRTSLSCLLAGIAIGYALLGQIEGSWPIALALFVLAICSISGQAGSGAVFAMVPLVQRRMTGQIAGMAGAYGNVGGVVFLTILSFVDYSTFFLVIAGCAAVVLLAVQLMDEPEGHIAEIREDGTVELIEVA